MLVIYKKTDGRIVGCFSDEAQTLDTLYPSNNSVKNALDTTFSDDKTILMDMSSYCYENGQIVRKEKQKDPWQ